MASLNNFIATVKTQGLARSNRFSVLIPFPMRTDVDTRGVTIMCDSVSMPGISLATSEQKLWGEVRELPYQPIYEPVTFSFYVDTNLNVKYMFESWMSLIRNPQTRTLNYYNNYVVDIDIMIHPLNSDEESVHTVTLHEAYPKTINAVQLDYGNKDVMKYTVTMNYKWYETTLNMIDTSQSTVNQDPEKVITGTGYEPQIGQFGSLPGIFKVR